MKTLNEVGVNVDLDQLKHLQVEHVNGEYIISLVDSKGYEIIKGYGIKIIEAINDMHRGIV